ncbi:hypothetical protein AOLI_G00040580 [Acnodon oligacanthus]
MAEASISSDQGQFSCPVCLDLLKDPVTTPCGHSYCMVCINGCWDQEDPRGVYSCPRCRDTFTPRPVLRRNNMMAEMLEKLKKPELRAASPAHCYAGPGDVECDFCAGRKRKAIKSCLACVASLCEAHLTPHLEIPALIKHQLVKASTRLQEKICSQHDKLIEIYCRTDQNCICYLCMVDEHKGHDMVSSAAERTEKQTQLKDVQMQIQKTILEKQKTLLEVKQAVDTLKRSAQTAVEDTERFWTELIRSIERKRSELTELIRAQEEAELSGAEELLEKLEQEIADLKRRHAELEQLSLTEDHVHFLQSFRSLCLSSGSEDPSSISVHQHLSFDGVRKSLSDLKERLEEFWKKEFSKVPPQAEGAAELEPTAAKFKSHQLAESFRKAFTEPAISQSYSISDLSRLCNPLVFFSVAVDGDVIGKITMELFSNIVPKTAENFRALCTGEKGFGYRNSVFHRVISDFMCQGGDITNMDGTGGKSIYGFKFEDENFDVRHTGPGLLSMANRGRNTNNSQFFITLKKADHLDFKHVAFGVVKEGIDVVKQVGKLGSKSGKPSKTIKIVDCGQL